VTFGPFGIVGLTSPQQITRHFRNGLPIQSLYWCKNWICLYLLYSLIHGLIDIYCLRVTVDSISAFNMVQSSQLAASVTINDFLTYFNPFIPTFVWLR